MQRIWLSPLPGSTFIGVAGMKYYYIGFGRSVIKESE
jgi:hypothetical protein